MSEPLNILVFVQDFLPLTQSFIYSEIIGLSKNNNVRVICFNETKEQLYHYHDVNQIKFRENTLLRKINSFLYRTGFVFLLKKPKLRKELSSIISSFQPDVIHAHFGHQSLPIIENIEHKEIPIFISFHGIDASLYIQKSKLYRSKIKEVLSRKRVHPIFVSNYLIENLKKYNIESENSSVHYLGINTEKFKRTKWPSEEPFTFLQIGAFRPKKGHIYTIRAFKRLLGTTKKVKLLFAGSGPEEARIKQYVSDNKMDSYVSFTGDVEQEKVVELLNEAQAFIHPSITDKEGNTEGLPVSIKEAMSMQLPIVSTRHSGISELIQDGSHGYLCEERDEVCLYKKMVKVMEMPYLKVNRDLIVKDHNILFSTDKLIQLYRNAIQKS